MCNDNFNNPNLIGAGNIVSPCPACGFCPSCGRRNVSPQPIWVVPYWNQPYPTPTWPWGTTISTTTLDGTLSNSSNALNIS